MLRPPDVQSVRQVLPGKPTSYVSLEASTLSLPHWKALVRPQRIRKAILQRSRTPKRQETPVTNLELDVRSILIGGLIDGYSHGFADGPVDEGLLRGTGESLAGLEFVQGPFDEGGGAVHLLVDGDAVFGLDVVGLVVVVLAVGDDFVEGGGWRGV